MQIYAKNKIEKNYKYSKAYFKRAKLKSRFKNSNYSD